MQITEALLTKNPFSRPGTKMKTKEGIVLHYVGNANSTAIANRNYFENLKSQKETPGAKLRYASSHEIIGLQGEVVICVPADEVAYHAGPANSTFYGIEVCHPKADGAFSEVTTATLVDRCVQICIDNKLDPRKKGVIKRHYDVTEKLCPIYYVRNPKAWTDLLTRINKAYETKTVHNQVLPEAVSRLVKAKYIGDYNAWKREDLIKLPNVPYLMCNLAKVQYKGKPTQEEYKEATQIVVDKLQLSDPKLWLEERYQVKHVVALLIKAAQTLA